MSPPPAAQPLRRQALWGARCGHAVDDRAPDCMFEGQKFHGAGVAHLLQRRPGVGHLPKRLPRAALAVHPVCVAQRRSPRQAGVGRRVLTPRRHVDERCELCAGPSTPAPPCARELTDGGRTESPVPIPFPRQDLAGRVRTGRRARAERMYPATDESQDVLWTRVVRRGGRDRSEQREANAPQLHRHGGLVVVVSASSSSAIPIDLAAPALLHRAGHRPSSNAPSGTV